MSRDDARWADRLLAGARASVEPLPEDATRNFAAIEARLGGALDAPPNAAARRLGESAVVARLPRPLAPLAASSASAAAARELPALAKAGLVLAFGLGTGLVGYWMGRAETLAGRELAAPDAIAASVQAAPSTLQPQLALPLGHTEQVEASAPAAEATAVDSSARALPSDQIVAPAGARRAETRRAPARARLAADAQPARPARADTAEAPFALRDALELLRRAEAALRRSDGLEARMWLGDLDRRAPPGLLLEERLVSKALADCAVGDVAQAQEALAQLVRQNPESMYRARLEGSCVADRLRQP